jgi:AcrR family transcriptional regulator
VTPRVTPRLNPRRQRSLDRILSGTATVAHELGITGMKVDDILGAAGVSRRTFYQCHANKEAALAALYQDRMTRLIALVDQAIATTPDPVGRIYAVLDEYVAFQASGGAALIQLQAEAVRTDSLLAPVRQRTLDTLVGLIDAGVQDAVFLTLDPLIYRAMLMGIEGLVIHSQQDGTFDEADKAAVRSAGRALVMGTLTSFMIGPDGRVKVPTG